MTPTRSIIGVHLNNTVRSVYCHYDGYPEHVGTILEQHYQSPEKRFGLISLGDLSSIDAELTPPIGAHHSFDRRCPGVTVAYHRDRGEDFNPPEETDFAKYMLNPPEHGQDYTYLHDGDRWLVKSENGWERIPDALKRREDE